MAKLGAAFAALRGDVSSRGSRRAGAGSLEFDVVEPAKETALAPVASARVSEANAASEAPAAAGTALAPWDRVEALRWVLAPTPDRREDCPRRIPTEYAQARSGAMGEVAPAAEGFGPATASQASVDANDLVGRAIGLLHRRGAHSIAMDIGRGLQVRERPDYGTEGLGRGLLPDPAAPLVGVLE